MCTDFQKFSSVNFERKKKTKVFVLKQEKYESGRPFWKKKKNKYEKEKYETVRFGKKRRKIRKCPFWKKIKKRKCPFGKKKEIE